MIVKSRIVEEVGAGSLLLPDIVGDALVANDQVKYLFTLLQASRHRADHEGDEVSNLRREREVCRLDDAALDAVVPGSRSAGPGTYLIPHAASIHEQIVTRVERMMRPFLLADGLIEEDAHQALQADHRRLVGAAPTPDGERVSADYLAWATRGLHLFVMALHKELHRLQAHLAQESLDGAKVFGLTADDQARVRAFMRGLNDTSLLKFDHPGLGTTAMRSGDTLTIENDIGSTNAHVIVLTIRGLETRVVYTDVHRRRARFFRDLLDGYGVEWSEAEYRRCPDLGEETDYLMITGQLVARDAAEMDRYLEHLGSRVVFLIDWNRARKRLRRFVKKSECVPLLRWAADHHYGHRAFLQLGGDQLLYNAIERVGRGRVRYGQRLDECLGEREAVAFLRYTLRSTSDGLRYHRSPRFIEDEIDAELLRCLRGAPDAVLDLLSHHAALVFELASAVRDGLVRADAVGGDEFRARVARRADEWENRADGLVAQIRARPPRSTAMRSLGEALREADLAADRLEVASFALTLVPDGSWATPFISALTDLASVVLRETQEFVKAAEAAVATARTGSREDVQDFLEAVDAVVGLEQQTDDAQRRVASAIYEHARDFRELHLVASVARSLERVGDALVGAALHLKDFALDRPDERRPA